MDALLAASYDLRMQAGQPSRTALGAATHRATHQLLEHGRIFSDPFALAILGADADTLAREAPRDAFTRALRIFIAVRSRLAEDALAAAVARGVRQLVVLGAGLDTYAYRSASGPGLRMFEVDHPATQAWKRERLAEASIPLPAALTFAPVDFERESLAAGLAAAGFDCRQQTFFTWLGVVPYLSETAVFGTLAFIASLAGGAHVVFDYANPTTGLAAPARAAHDALAARVAAAGETFKCFFETSELRERLHALGFPTVDDLGPAEIAARYVPGRIRRPGNRGGHIVRAVSASVTARDSSGS
jgi:methyltransferase (TIGR00027 family)